MVKVKQFLKSFIYETFRKRSVEDYKSLNKESNETSFPWFYLRILIIGFITFSIFFFINYICDLGINLYLVFLSGITFNLCFLFIAYELDNNKELTIWELLTVVIVSMTSIFIPLIVSKYIFVTDVEYLSAIRAGVGEELIKAIYAILIVYLLQYINKKKFTLGTILIIGFAVGIGFSIAEDFGYLNPRSNDFATITERAIVRGLCDFHGHMAWTGLITYAFFKFKKPLINYRFYLVLIGCMAIHTLWDISSVSFMNDVLYNCIYYFVLAIHLFLSIAITLIILIRNNKKNDEVKDDKDNKLSRFEVNRIIAFLTISIFLLFGYQYIKLDSSEELFNEFETYEYYDTFENFKYKLQGNMKFNIDRNREYNPLMVDKRNIYEYGVLVSATQAVEDGNVSYLYYYQLDEESGKLKLVDVDVQVGKVIFFEQYLSPIEEDNDQIYPYYDLIGISGYSSSIEIYSSELIEREFIDFAIDKDENVYIVGNDKTTTAKFCVLVGCACGVLVCGGIVMIVYNKKKREE